MPGPVELLQEIRDAVGNLPDRLAAVLGKDRPARRDHHPMVGGGDKTNSPDGRHGPAETALGIGRKIGQIFPKAGILIDKIERVAELVKALREVHDRFGQRRQKELPPLTVHPAGPMRKLDAIRPVPGVNVRKPTMLAGPPQQTAAQRRPTMLAGPVSRAERQYRPTMLREFPLPGPRKPTMLAGPEVSPSRSARPTLLAGGFRPGAAWPGRVQRPSAEPPTGLMDVLPATGMQGPVVTPAGNSAGRFVADRPAAEGVGRGGGKEVELLEKLVSQVGAFKQFFSALGKKKMAQGAQSSPKHVTPSAPSVRVNGKMMNSNPAGGAGASFRGAAQEVALGESFADVAEMLLPLLLL